MCCYVRQYRHPLLLLAYKYFTETYPLITNSDLLSDMGDNEYAADLVAVMEENSTFRVRVLVGDPDVSAYCSTPTLAMRDARTPFCQTVHSLASSDYPLAIAVGYDDGDGNGPRYVRAFFVSWRCIQFSGMHDVAMGWYAPIPAGVRFKIFVLNHRYIGLIRIGMGYLDEVTEEVFPDVRVEGEAVCGARGPGLDGRRYVTLPRTAAGGVVLSDFADPAPGNNQEGVDIRLLGRQGEVRSRDPYFNAETVPCGEVDLFIRTPAWCRARRIITASGSVWRLPPRTGPDGVLLPQKRERQGSVARGGTGVRGGRSSRGTRGGGGNVQGGGASSSTGGTGGTGGTGSASK